MSIQSRYVVSITATGIWANFKFSPGLLYSLLHKCPWQRAMKPCFPSILLGIKYQIRLVFHCWLAASLVEGLHWIQNSGNQYIYVPKSQGNSQIINKKKSVESHNSYILEAYNIKKRKKRNDQIETVLSLLHIN